METGWLLFCESFHAGNDKIYQAESFRFGIHRDAVHIRGIVGITHSKLFVSQFLNTISGAEGAVAGDQFEVDIFGGFDTFVDIVDLAGISEDDMLVLIMHKDSSENHQNKNNNSKLHQSSLRSAIRILALRALGFLLISSSLGISGLRVNIRSVDFLLHTHFKNPGGQIQAASSY